MNVQCELCKTQVDLGNITHQLGCCYDDLIKHEEEPEENQIEQAKSCDKKYCAVFLQLLNTALAIWATDSEHIKTGYIVVIGLVGALNKLLGVNNWAAFPPEKECTCCTTPLELIKCGSHYRTGPLRELEGDVVAKLIEADCVDGLFQFLRTRGFAMGSEGSGAKRIQFSTDWRDPTPTDNEKKVYRQMQETRRVLHLAAQHRSVNCLQLLLKMLRHAGPANDLSSITRKFQWNADDVADMPDSVAPRYTPLLLVLEHGDGGRKTVDALKVLINAKADVDAGAERGHRWESVLMKRDQLSDEVFALLCKHSKRDGGDVRAQMQEKRFQAAFLKVVRAKKPAAVANLSAQHKVTLVPRL